MLKNLSVGYLLDFYGGLLTERQRRALDMYYNMDYSLSEIAEEFGVTRQGVHAFILKGEERLRHLEETLCLAAFYRAASETLDAIDTSGESEEVRKAARPLRALLERDKDGI